MQTLQVQAYSLIDFIIEYEKGRAEGFTMSTDSGYAPVEIAGFYVCTMVKAEEPVEEKKAEAQEPVVPAQPDGETQEESEEPTAAKRGRKPKA